MRRERYRKWMKWKERQGWNSEKISGIFLRKFVEKQKRERRDASIFGFLRVASNFRLPREKDKHKSSWTGLVRILLQYETQKHACLPNT